MIDCHDCETLWAWDGLFTSWKFGFVFILSFITSNSLYLSLSTLYPSFFYGELHQISPLFSNKPPVPPSLISPPPSNWFEMNKPYGGGGGGLTEDLHYAAVYVGMWLQVYWSGAHNPERATPILVLCHGIFTEHFIGFLDTFIQYWFQL